MNKPGIFPPSTPNLICSKVVLHKLVGPVFVKTAPLPLSPLPGPREKQIAEIVATTGQTHLQRE